MNRRRAWGFRLPGIVVISVLMGGCDSAPKSPAVGDEPAPIRSLSDFKNITLRGELGTRLATASSPSM